MTEQKPVDRLITSEDELLEFSLGFVMARAVQRGDITVEAVEKIFAEAATVIEILQSGKTINLTLEGELPNV